MAFIPESRSLTVCIIIVDRSVCTAYPMALDGVAHEVAVEHIAEWANGCRRAGGRIDRRCRPSVLRYWVLPALRQVPERYRFALAAFAYTLSKAESHTFRGPDGIEHSTRHMADYRPFPRGDIDDFVYQSPVKSVNTTCFNEKIVYCLTIPLFRLGRERRLPGHRHHPVCRRACDPGLCATRGRRCRGSNLDAEHLLSGMISTFERGRYFLAPYAEVCSCIESAGVWKKHDLSSSVTDFRRFRESGNSSPGPTA